MRGSAQAAGRKPEPNNRGKWRNWKKTQWQHSQHRWFSAELRDSWEKALSGLCPGLRWGHLGLSVPGGSRARPCPWAMCGLAVGSGPAGAGWLGGWEAVPPLSARESC